MENNATWNDKILISIEQDNNNFKSCSISKKMMLEKMSKAEITPLHMLVLDNLSKAHELCFSKTSSEFEIILRDSEVVLKTYTEWSYAKKVMFDCTGLTDKDFRLPVIEDFEQYF